MRQHLEYIRKGFLSALLMLTVGLTIGALVIAVMYFAAKHPVIGYPSLALVYVLFFAWVNGRYHR